jgi:hypothetical protein
MVGPWIGQDVGVEQVLVAYDLLYQVLQVTANGGDFPLTLITHTPLPNHLVQVIQKHHPAHIYLPIIITLTFYNIAI